MGWKHMHRSILHTSEGDRENTHKSSEHQSAS